MEKNKKHGKPQKNKFIPISATQLPPKKIYSEKCTEFLPVI
jgi:hypothetical protein